VKDHRGLMRVSIIGLAILDLIGCRTAEVGHQFYLGTDRSGREIMGGQCWNRGEWAATCKTVRVTNDRTVLAIRGPRESPGAHRNPLRSDATGLQRHRSPGNL
jgi:hypothetical protein